MAVVGTGTGVGKTRVAALLVQALVARGLDVAASKPLASGCQGRGARPVSEDALALARALGGGARPQRHGNAAPGSATGVTGPGAPRATLARLHDEIAPWRARAPLAPGLALDRAPTLAALVRHVEERARGRQVLVVEGAGGLVLPYGSDGTVLDFLRGLRRCRALSLRILLVGASSLGTINHSCLSVGALRAAALEPAALVLSRTRRARTPDERSNAAVIARLAQVSRPTVIPFVDEGRGGSAARRIAMALSRQLVPEGGA